MLSLKEDLADCLRRHIAGTRVPGSIVTGTTLREYESEVKRIRTKYATPPRVVTDEDFAVVERQVDGELFAWSRKAVEKCVDRLDDGTETDVLLETFDELTCTLFQPLFNKLIYDASAHFESYGGVPKLMSVLRASYERCKRTEAGSDVNVCVQATRTMVSFGNDDDRVEASAEGGFLALIVEMLRSAPSDRIKGQCLRALCAYTDNSAWQIFVAQAGAFEPLLEYATSGLVRLSEAECAVAGLTCCAANPRVLDFLLSVNAAERLAVFASRVAEVYRDECASYSLHFHGVNIIKSLPTHISYLCLVGISQILHQLNARHWRQSLGQLRKIRISGKTANLRDWFQLRPVSKQERGYLISIRQFVTSHTPEEIRFADDNRYSWPRLTPFTSLLWCVHAEAREMGAFALANLCHGGENRDVVQREEGRSLGPIQLACWKMMEPHGLSIKNRTRECGKKVAELAWNDGLEPPKLSQICSYFVSCHFQCCFSDKLTLLPLNLLMRLSPFLYNL
ncbi:uncharacterized protein [Oscarella lobularis]|uniref:uncharacterized protein n=1 Tax=Oscarella lobularis TaxID=121494 RepID=UPI00331445CE